MTVQASSVLVPTDIDLGNAVVYYSDSIFSSFSSAKSATTWRKLGLMKENTPIERVMGKIDLYSGVPRRKCQTYYISEELRFSGQILEINPRSLNRILGGLTITETVKSSNPAATTVATGSTKTVVNFTSTTGYAVGDEIRVGNSGSYQYGRIKSFNGSAVTLYEALSGDANPTTGHAIAKIDNTYYDLGSVAEPANCGIKISKTLIGGYGYWDLYIAKAKFTGDLSAVLSDGSNNVDSIGLPFTLEAYSDPDVESGNLARWDWTQS